LAVTDPSAWLWLTIFALINVLMLIAADTTWTFVGRRAETLDDMLGPAKGYSAVVEWVDHRLTHRQQLVLPASGAISGTLFLRVVEQQLDPIVEVGLASYVTVAFTSFIGGNVCYWLWVAPGLARRIYRAGQLNIRWQDPASTPGIRLAAEGYGVAALFLLAGALSISVAGFVFTGAARVPALQLLLTAFFVLVVATSIRVGIVPFLWMYAVVANAKRETLTLLDAQVPSAGRVVGAWIKGRHISLLGLYSQISQTPNMPFSTAALVQYGAVLAGAVLAFVASLIIG
jgi:hypothetical protein